MGIHLLDRKKPHLTKCGITSRGILVEQWLDHVTCKDCLKKAETKRAELTCKKCGVIFLLKRAMALHTCD